MLLWAKLANPNVLVNSDGKIFRVCKKHGYESHKGFVGGMQELKTFKDKGGYSSVHINNKSFKVHRIVMEAFRGLCPTGYEVDHINRNREDNRLENLRYVTRKENMQNTSKVFVALAHDSDYATKAEANKARDQKRGLYRTTRNGKCVYLPISERKQRRNDLCISQ